MKSNIRDFLKETMEEIAGKLGSRPLGSYSHELTRGYIIKKLQMMRIHSNTQEFRTEFSLGINSSIRLLGSKPKIIESWPAFGTMMGIGIKGEVVNCGFGTPDEIGHEISGNIGLVQKGKIHEESKIENLAEQGAIGALLFVDFGNVLYSPRVSRKISRIPAAVIRKDDAQVLISRRMKQKIEMNVNASMVNAKCANIIADLTRNSQNYFLLSAHYDSRSCTPGANDNASGVACLLGIAKLAMDGFIKVPMKLVFFDGEEVGLVGSNLFVKTHDLGGCLLVINIDGIGHRSLSVLTRDRNGPLDSDFSDYAINLASGLNIQLKEAIARTGTSDHSPFALRGKKVLWFSDHPNDGRETDEDILENVSIEELEDVTILVQELLRTEYVRSLVKNEPR